MIELVYLAPNADLLLVTPFGMTFTKGKHYYNVTYDHSYFYTYKRWLKENKYSYLGKL